MKRIEVKMDENEYDNEKDKKWLQVTTSRSVVTRNRSAGKSAQTQPIGWSYYRSVGARLFSQEIN